jgi:heme o synthase
MEYLKAAQPKVVALFLVTVLAAMLLAGSASAGLVIAVLAATALTVAGAAMLNNALERDVDARMERTRRRPTATGRLRPGRTLMAGLAAVAAGALALWAAAGGLAAVFALLGAAYYVLVYTLLLKPRTALSSVPGALAGVFPALIGWAATGAPWSADILFLCAVVFTWSPPHFWALSLAREDDYRSSGIPVPAIRYGHRITRILIALFFALLTGIVAAAAVTGLFGLLYLTIAVAASLVLWLFAGRLLAARTSGAAWTLFKVSGPCLAAIVAAAVLDRLL